MMWYWCFLRCIFAPYTTSMQPPYTSACVSDCPITVEYFKYCVGPTNHKPASEKRALTTRESACRCVTSLTNLVLLSKLVLVTTVIILTLIVYSCTVAFNFQ